MATRVSELESASSTRDATLDPGDDRVLVVDFQAGVSEAYALIYRRYYALARHICFRMLGNTEDAEEAAQETMLRVYQGLPRFNGRYDLRAWVARIATNVSLDGIRARARRPLNGATLHELTEAGRADPDEDPSELVERILESERVRAVLEELPDHHRDALVLREFEGRSHQEIGDALGVSSSQAKALIHRAKGSFRRAWRGEDGERRGLAGLVPFLLPHRLFGLFRRVADRATEAGQQITASPAATAAASSAAVPVAASQTAERVVAAAVTLLVAGSVTVGAATLTHRKAEPPPTRSPAAVAPAPSQPTLAPAVRSAQAPGLLVKGPKVHRRAVGGPSGTPSPDPSGTPSPDPSGTPSPDPSGTPPPIPPAPDWSGSFKVDWTSQDECGCGSGVSVGSTTVSGQLTDGSALDVDQSFQGAALDAEGDAAWAVSAEYQAHLLTDGGTVTIVFILGSGDDTHQYVMSASSPAIGGTPGDGNPVVYTFSGSYSDAGANSETSPIPVQGSVQLRLSVWGDGTSVYTVGFDAWR